LWIYEKAVILQREIITKFKINQNMKNFYSKITFLFLLLSITMHAQQLPNSNFEDWSGDAFDGVAQPKSWNYSNVTQFGYKFNFAHKEAGHNGGSCIMVQDQALEVAGIGETSPGYIALGKPWVYIESLTKVKEATAGTEGGISWKYRPDTMVVWIRRTGDNTMNEDFHLLYYSWSGTARSDKYKGKNGECTSTSRTNEESDIRLSTNGNECGTVTPANQIAEGWVYGRKTYKDWTLIKVPIYYLNNTVPEMMNVIFSASNYPNFRANSGLYAGNSLYVDDVQLIYSSKIQQLIIGGEEWTGFDPNSTDVQPYVLAEGVNTMPTIKAMRGAGQLVNTKNATITYRGRQLQDNEIEIKNGEIDKTPTQITVKAEDGSSTTTYQILFCHKASNNAYLSKILANGEGVKGFSPYYFDYTVDVPYGANMPVISVEKQEEEQDVQFSQPTSINDVTSIVVTAADRQTKKTYTLRYKQALLSDNTLDSIYVNNKPVSGFSPSKTSYKVSISPAEATKMPEVRVVSKYADGLQTIVMTPPSEIDGGVYKIAVSTPGNPTPKEYKLTFKVELSSYCFLNKILLDGVPLDGFDSETSTYSHALAMGTTQLPKIEYELGDPSQTVVITEGGLDGTTRITVTAANGDQFTYRITFSTAKSTISTLDGITLDGVVLEGFDKNITSYTIQLPIGTSQLPKIDVIKGDPYQNVSIRLGELNGITRITVQAGDGSTTIYQITFSVSQATNATLLDITINGETLPGFDPNIYEYSYELPHGTTQLPTIGYTPYDQYQTITTRADGVDGDYRITVRTQSGVSKTYIIHFSVPKFSNSKLSMIYLDGVAIQDFNADSLNYVDTLETMVLPNITYDAEPEQKILTLYENSACTIKVTAEDGSSRTYTITFVVRVSKNAFLNMIYLNGDSLEGFEPERLSYTKIPIKNHTCPIITVDSEQGQQVSILAPASTGTASIIVTAGSGDNNTYLLELIDTVSSSQIDPLEPDPVYVLSSDATLRTILVDGDSLATFAPCQTLYTLSLDAGDTIPAITFVPNTDKQAIVYGQCASNQFSALVVAENGDTTRYVVTLEWGKYSYSLLKNLSVDGQDLPFDPNTFDYQLQLTEGEALPQVSYETYPGETTMLYALDANHQQLIVTAQNGEQTTYNISYTREQSSYALLSNILLDEDLALADFDPQRFNYVDSLQWRTNFVPCVNAIPGHSEQTITTAYSGVNGTTHIYVVAADGVNKAEYTISFPVKKSSNTLLEEIAIDDEIIDGFNSDQTDYIVSIPYSTSISPSLQYTTQEPEQTVSMVLRPIGQANEITVHAEDGQTRTYTITFQRGTTPNNVLEDIRVIVGENIIPLDLQENQYSYSVDLPYGTKSMNVSYIKSYDEQTVVVQPGGIYKPSLLKVYSNIDKTTTTYTITPNLCTQTPAVVNGITIDGVALNGFDKNRFSYIVNRDNAGQWPKVLITKDNNVSTDVTSSPWMSTIVVSSAVDTNTYSIFYHYPNDVIPNGEFDQWTKTSSSNTDKPIGWNVPGDYLNTYAGTAKAGQTISKDGSSAVHLKTTYWGALLGPVPAVMNLGSMDASFAVAGGTRVVPSGNISYHNSPDSSTINYKYPNKNGNGALVRLKFIDNNSVTNTCDFNITSKSNDYSVQTKGLGLDGKNILGLDIIIDATGQYPDASSDADFYVDYIRFSYNNRLAGLQVNGQNASLTGNKFSYTIDVHETQIPKLTFLGEVQDQAQKVVWVNPQLSSDRTYSIRKAAITNYGEDGKTSSYTLEIKRPLDTINSLNNILVNGSSFPDFQANQKQYTYTLPYGSKALPDIVPVLASELETCTATIQDSLAIIAVKSEKGTPRTYYIRFKTEHATTNKLQNIHAKGITFSPDIASYTIDTIHMPSMEIVKQFDEQIVHVANGQIRVDLDGLETTIYSILLNPTPNYTTGLLKDIEIDGNPLTDFNSTKFDYEHELPLFANFTRQDAIDSVVFVRKPDTMWWHIYGSNSDHIYTLAKPIEGNTLTTLQGIYINGELIEDFNAQIDEYTIYSDTAIQLSAIGADAHQAIAIQHNQGTYTIKVTSPDGTATATYIVHLLPTTSSEARLESIYVDGQPLPAFSPNRHQYAIELSAGIYKDHEPIMPSLHYVTAHPKATVKCEINPIGETSYLIVTSPDGMNTITYELFFNAEASHNAYLSAIAVNDIPLSNFQQDRYYYSMQMTPDAIHLDWRSQDRFQTVTVTNEDNQYTLHVVAQDNQTTRDYIVEIYSQSLSSDATISNITLDGLAMENYRTDINKGLAFNPGMNRYTINIPSRLATLPNISASLKEVGQSVQISKTQNMIQLLVTAPDGINQNTYTLQFEEVLSQNTSLKGIILDTDSMEGFDPDQLFYFIPLENGQRSIPDIIPLWDKLTQKVDTTISTLPIGQQVLIDVTAEDGEHKATYTLIFQIFLSDVDTLRSLIADSNLHYSAQVFNYVCTIPYNKEQKFPELEYEPGDKYQTVLLDTTELSEYQLTRLLTVTAENGQCNRYTITYTMTRPTTALQTILLNGLDTLPGFMPGITDYLYTLPCGTNVAPQLVAEPMEVTQEIAISEIEVSQDDVLSITQILVTALNGDTRTYTITFHVAPDTTATLSMIQYNGQPVPRFYELTMKYDIQLGKDDAAMPIITFTKHDEKQNVEIVIVDTNQVQLIVTAADRKTQATYTLTFLPYLSNNALLDAIKTNESIIDGFMPTIFGYEITIDSLRQLPQISYTKAEYKQEVTMDTTYLYTNDSLIYNVTYVIGVVAEDGESSEEYTVTFLIKENIPLRPEESENTSLQTIMINQQKLSTKLGFNQDFTPEITDYYLVYPIGTDPSSFFTDSDVDASPEDSLATISKNQEVVATAKDTADNDIVVSTCIHILVKAPAGNVSTYNIYQTIMLDSLNHATELLIANSDGELQALPGFDPQIYYYEYILADIYTNAPDFMLNYDNTDSRFAYVKQSLANNSRVVESDDNTNYADDNSEDDPTYHIYYRAENGTKYTYKIKFRRTDIKRAQKPMEGDVLIQPIPGSTQIAVASLRANVVFSIYDMAGKMVESVKLPEGNPNSFITTTDGYGQTYFGHLTDLSSCTIITLEANKIYFWVFTENSKRKIKSGKLTILP